MKRSKFAEEEFENIKQLIDSVSYASNIKNILSGLKSCCGHAIMQIIFNLKMN